MGTKTRERAEYRCTECGYSTTKWVGRCPECQSWGTVDGVAGIVLSGAVKPGPVSAPAVPIADIDVAAALAHPSGVTEFDRVLGGGLVPGAVILLAGEPGVGKSTLLLDVASRVAVNKTALVITGEESAAQVRLRAERIGALHPQLYLAAETDLAALLSHIDLVKPDLLIVDSVQTISSSLIEGTAGGVNQVRAVAAALIAIAKQRGITTVLVGHVTKEGGIAGPRVLEHLVDIVLHFEGDRHAALRLVRAVKNRFGPADEIGCFEMFDGGIRGLADPSGLFTSGRTEGVSGTCVTVTLEGRRPLLAEVQALVAPSNLATPRRAVSGLDSARIAMVLAVTERRGRVRLAERDVFAASVGGAKITEPASDLATALAVTSAAREVAVPADVVAIGEVALSGELRRVTGIGRRLSEAARLGFARALVPSGSLTDTRAPNGLAVTELANLGEALSLLN